MLVDYIYYIILLIISVGFVVKRSDKYCWDIYIFLFLGIFGSQNRDFARKGIVR